MRYAVSKGVLVVAAVGNADDAPTEPWGYAGYPAALPHVLGVSALARDGSVPNFSNRDRRHNDIAAPGEGIFSTLPRAVTSESRPACLLQGYSDCGPVEFRRGEGTSFSAPQVAGAAAVLFGVTPLATADQVANAPHAVGRGRGPRHGLRSLLDRPRRPDRLGLARRHERCSHARATRRPPRTSTRRTTKPRSPPRSGAARASGFARRSTTGTTGSDAYKIKLRPGQRLVAVLKGPIGANANLFLWKPGTKRIGGKSADRRLLAAQSRSPGSRERIRLTVRQKGWYYLVVKVSTPGSGRYSLRYRKRAPLARPAALP